MTVLLGLGVGAILAAVAWRLLEPVFAHEVFARQNFRGRRVPTAAGLVIGLVLLAVDAVVSLVEAGGADASVELVTGRRLMVLGGLALALLGLLDDLAGAGESMGFAGHLSALGRGRLTTGAVKLVGGGAVGVLLAATFEPGSLGRVIADGALIALCANAANLFDRAPGRTVKVTVLAFVGLVAVVGATESLFGVAVAVGAAIGLLGADLGERLMLGDAGANVCGGALGLGVVLTTGPTARTGVLVAVIALNLLSERVSFSKVIAATPGLRELDRLGRQP